MGLSRVGRRGQTLFPLEAKPSVLVVINEALDLLKSALVFKRQFARPAVAVMKFSPPCYYDSFFFSSVSSSIRIRGQVSGHKSCQ